MEAEVKPVQSSIPLGKDTWLFVPTKGEEVPFVVEAGQNILDALYEQKGVGVEFYKTTFIDSVTKEVQDTYLNQHVGFMYKTSYAD